MLCKTNILHWIVSSRSLLLLKKKTKIDSLPCSSVHRHFSSNSNLFQKKTEVADKEVKYSLLQHIYNKIITTGPISVAEFMRLTLTNPSSGYYMNRDMLGAKGDFVTSPELSQMFGELIAIWIVTEWIALGSPQEFRIVELGPGRGTLAEDILRTFAQLKHTLKDVQPTLHFVEVSPTLTEIQHNKLCKQSPGESPMKDNQDGWHKCGVSENNNLLYWHKLLDTVPHDKCTFFIAHEFFDALPIHKFIKDEGVWKEIYVDACPKRTSPPSPELRFIIIPNPTPACKTLIQDSEHRSHIEVSPQSGIICQSIASRIAEKGGAALIADYGHFGTKEDTLRAFKQHKLVEVLSDVGESDVTADVDFKYLRDTIQDFDVSVSGPITQHKFLKNMGIDTRLMMLLRSCSDADVRRKLVGSYDVIMNPSKMGERFKFFAITSRNKKTGNGFNEATGFQNASSTQS